MKDEFEEAMNELKQVVDERIKPLAKRFTANAMKEEGASEEKAKSGARAMIACFVISELGGSIDEVVRFADILYEVSSKERKQIFDKEE